MRRLKRLRRKPNLRRRYRTSVAEHIILSGRWLPPTKCKVGVTPQHGRLNRWQQEQQKGQKMNCPACCQPVSSLRYPFALNGVSFGNAIQGYLKCQNCGKLLRMTNMHLPIIASTIAGVLAVAIYVMLFRSIRSLVGFSMAVAVFFPFIIMIAVPAASFVSSKYSKLAVVHEAEKNLPS